LVCRLCNILPKTRFLGFKFRLLTENSLKIS
jgi:hypothetical protein